MKIIVGLGNPDKKYEGTRHNAGFMAIDRLAQEQNLAWHFDKNFNAQIAKGFDAYLVKPLSYMNASGEVVQKIMAYYHLLPQDHKGKVAGNANLADSLVVIHDDLDIALGSYKLSTGGSAAGHNGIKSIIESLGTPNFTRLRLGVATPNLDKARRSIFPNAVARFVLKKFPAEEKSLLESAINQGLKAI